MVTETGEPLREKKQRIEREESGEEDQETINERGKIKYRLAREKKARGRKSICYWRDK